MLLDVEQLLIISIVAICAIITLLVSWKTRNSKSSRVELLWILVILNGIFFSIGLLFLVIILPQSLLNVISWLVYDLLLSFAISVEIPGYLKLSAFDQKHIDVVKEIRSNLIKMRYSFDKHFEDLKKSAKGNASVLREEKIDDLLDDFISVCDSIRNVDVNLWKLTLEETTDLISNISNRSKHPLPKLIDILTLSGLSLLLAQFLKLLG